MYDPAAPPTNGKGQTRWQSATPVLSKRRLGPWFLFALLVLLAWHSLRVIAVFLDWLLVGLFVGLITHPMYRAVLRRVKRPALAGTTMLVFIIGIVVVPMVVLSAELVGELQDLGEKMGLDEPEVLVESLSGSMGRALGVDEATMAGVLTNAITSIKGFAEEQSKTLPAALAGAFIGAFVLLYILFYVYVDGEAMLAFIRELLPMDEGHRDMLLHEVALVIRAVLYGTVLTALLQATLGAIGFMLFGVPNVLLWAVVMFVLALLPVIGPPLVWAPWGIYLISNDQVFEGVALIAYSAILVSTIDNLVRPQLIGSVADIHPAIILLGVLGGVAVMGFPGFILGPLILSIFITLLKVYRKEFASRLEEGDPKEVWM